MESKDKDLTREEIRELYLKKIDALKNKHAKLAKQQDNISHLIDVAKKKGIVLPTWEFAEVKNNDNG